MNLAFAQSPPAGARAALVLPGIVTNLRVHGGKFLVNAQSMLPRLVRPRSFSPA
jgi:hypothetical protein